MPKHPADERADEVERIIARDYTQALRVSKAEWKWAGCHDRGTEGYAAVSKCLEDVVATMQLEALRVAKEDATDPCSQEIEREAHGYVRAALAYHQAMLEWMKANRGRLLTAMNGRALGDTCRAISCPPRPTENVGKHEGSTFLRVGQIECTDGVFLCPPRGNKCGLVKIGTRLGLADGGRAPVTVRGGSGRSVSISAYVAPGVTVDVSNL